jgi:hypothetical protein
MQFDRRPSRKQRGAQLDRVKNPTQQISFIDSFQSIDLPQVPLRELRFGFGRSFFVFFNGHVLPCASSPRLRHDEGCFSRVSKPLQLHHFRREN